MDSTRIAELEWANYAATSAVARAIPDYHITMRPDLILSLSRAFPLPDVNHACLLRTTPERADGLIAEVVDAFHSYGLPATVFLSPACTPADLPERLEARGFVRQEGAETWLVVENLQAVPIPPPRPDVAVRRLNADEAITFATIFLAAFDLPTELAPYLAQMLAPSIGLPTVHHYVALSAGQPVGVCTLLTHERFGVLGSAGVLPAHRLAGAAQNLAIQSAADAQAQGVQTLMVQTQADTWIERLLTAYGFVRAFTRVGYVLKP